MTDTHVVICAMLFLSVNSINAQEKILWNFEVESRPYPKGFEFLPQFPSEKACTPYLRKVSDDILTDSLLVLKAVVNKNCLPPDADIKAHLLAVVNPRRGTPRVVWNFHPNKKQVELVEDAFIIQWQKNKEIYYFLDSHPDVVLCVWSEPQKFNNIQEFILSRFQRYLPQKDLPKLPQKDKIVLFDNSLKGSYAGYVSLEANTPNGFSNIYLFFYHENGYFFILSQKSLMNLGTINVSRFAESAKFHYMIGGPEQDWTEFNKAYAKEQAERDAVREDWEEKFTKACQSSAATEEGRAALIKMIGQKKNDKLPFLGKAIADIFPLADYQDIAYKALRDGYLHAWSEKIERGRYSVYSAKGIQHVETYSGYTKNRLSITNRQEALTLLSIFQSNGAQAKQYAFMLMKEARCASIAPELLKMISVQKQTLTNAEEHAKTDFSTASSGLSPYVDLYDDPEEKIPDENAKPTRHYHFLECVLLGRFGDEKTLKALKELQKKPDVAKELQEDIALMIENIEKELAEHEQWQKEVWAMRKLAREKKIAYDPSDPRFADLEKDDPEPVSPEGFRNWATTDGLFNVYAKFVSYDAKTDDVTLQKPDGKTTAIERSALRQIDQEYVKQREQK